MKQIEIDAMKTLANQMSDKDLEFQIANDKKLKTTAYTYIFRNELEARKETTNAK